MIGELITHYKILEQIADGPVFKADDTRLGRTVVLRFLPDSLSRDPEERARFTQQARTAASLEHPNICTIYEIGDLDGKAFVAMAYVPGTDLKTRLETGPLPLEDVLETSIQIASGLEEAHAAGMNHGRIRPSNIMLSRKGQAKILGFGLEFSPDVDSPGDDMESLHHLAYKSPEQLRGDTVDAGTDMWSLGALVYEMATGRRPFDGSSQDRIKQSILAEAPAPPSSLVGGLPEELDRIIEKALSKSRAARYEDTSQIVAELKALDRKVKHRARLQSRLHESVPAIAVLPFVDMSTDQDQEYFCDGIADEITNALGKLDGVRVASRTSAFQFKGDNRPVGEIGEKLNVDSILEGSVRKAGSMLRITAQLVSAIDGYHLWSGRFDRDIGDSCCPEDIFSIQDEITRAVVEKLRVRLIEDEEDRLVTRKTDSMDAFKSYLKGRHFWNKRTEKSLLKAIGYFEQAIEADPKYARAYSGLADCHAMMGDYSYTPPAEGYARAREMAMTALELDPDSAEAHATLGLVKTLHELDREGAEKEFITALDLDPDYSTAHHWYALHLMLWRRFDEAVEEIKLAANLDPLSLIISRNIGQVLMYARRYDEALEAYRQILGADPEFSSTHFSLGQTYLYKGMYQEALEEFALQSESDDGSTPETDSFPAVAYAKLGNAEKAREILSTLKRRFSESYTSPFMIAVIHFALGETDEGFEWLEKGTGAHDHLITYIEVEPTLDPIRNDPRYEELVKKLGLAV